MSPWMRCPGCNQEGWFDCIGAAPPKSYRCRRCGNVERGIRCQDCDGGMVRTRWLHHGTNCRSCGSKKEPVWKSQR